jgi:hypothetical protein
MARGYNAGENRLAEQAKLNVLAMQAELRSAKEKTERVARIDKQAQGWKREQNKLISAAAKDPTYKMLADPEYLKSSMQNLNDANDLLRNARENWDEAHPEFTKMDSDLRYTYDTMAGTSDYGIWYDRDFKKGVSDEDKAKFNAMLKERDEYLMGYQAKADAAEKEWNNRNAKVDRFNLMSHLEIAIGNNSDAAKMGPEHYAASKLPYKQITENLADLMTEAANSNSKSTIEKTESLYQNPKTKKFVFYSDAKLGWKKVEFKYVVRPKDERNPSKNDYTAYFKQA